MKKSLYILMFLGLIVTVSSCYTVETITIDQLHPAALSFPKDIKSIGIVNNMGDLPDNKMITDSVTQSPFEIGRKVTYFNGNPLTATEALAEAIAAENFFEEVVICDSALRANDRFPRESTLSSEEVKKLTHDMGVNMIIALENLQIKETRLITYYPGWDEFIGTVDAKVYPSVSIYLPNRRQPMAVINASDSIFWEEARKTRASLHTRMIPEEKVIEEASVFAGSVPVKHLLPYWKATNRYLFSGGSVNMRDAAVFANENNWDKAAQLWEDEYQSTKKKKRKMRAAYNMGLYYDIKDNPDEAEAWLQKALNIATEVENIDERGKVDMSSGKMSYYAFINLYLVQIQTRKENLNKVKLQMDRFNDDSV